MTTEDPHRRVGIDILRPLTTTKSINRHTLATVDHFSKWRNVVLTPQQDAHSRVFTDHKVFRHVNPFSHPPDQGPAFKSHLFAQVCQTLGFRKTHTTARHSLVERANKTTNVSQ